MSKKVYELSNVEWVSDDGLIYPDSNDSKLLLSLVGLKGRIIFIEEQISRTFKYHTKNTKTGHEGSFIVDDHYDIGETLSNGVDIVIGKIPFSYSNDLR